MAKSKKVSDNPAKGIKWDLSDLYTSINDPQIEKDKEKVVKLVDLFTKSYQNKIKPPNLKLELLEKSLTDYEKILEKAFKINVYAYLLHSQDMSDHKIGVFYSKNSEFSSDINSKLLWYSNELKQISANKLKTWNQNKKLKDYSHFLNELIKFKPFTLSTKEEIVMAKKELTSTHAFVNFYDKTVGEERFDLKIKGKNKILTLSEITPIIKAHPDRKVRKAAAEEHTRVFENKKHFYTFVLNNLLLDKKIEDEMRGYEYPQQATFMSYEIDPKVVETMVSSVQNHTGIVEKYYTTKKKLIGIKKLDEVDRYSPIFNVHSKKYDWKDAQELVLSALAKAEPKMNSVAMKYFENGWIDAELKPHKQSGAFCLHGSKNTVPYVLTNFSGELGDVTTLAHELGHAIHGYLSRKENTLLEMQAPTTVAEIASIFAESLTFDLILDEVNDNKEKLNLLAEKIEGIFASVFRQTEFYLFETDIHAHRRVKGELSPEEFSGYYQKRLQHMFGRSLTLSDGHKWWWMPIMHFYHFNFYVFAYAFGELLSLALYAKYKEDGKKFMSNYIEALKAGGSKSPAEITAMMGVDIQDPKFWENGLELLKKYVDEFEELAGTV